MVADINSDETSHRLMRSKILQLQEPRLQWIERRTEVTVFDSYVRLAGTLAAERGSTGGLPVVLRRRRGGQNTPQSKGSPGVVLARPGVAGIVTPMIGGSGGLRRRIGGAPVKLE